MFQLILLHGHAALLPISCTLYVVVC